MFERALKNFQDSWNAIKSGDFFNENLNTVFDYTLKELWKTKHKDEIRADINKHLGQIFEKAKRLDDPPPVLYIIISLKDEILTQLIQQIVLKNFIKENASENATYQLINFIETFSEKQIPVEGFIKTIIKMVHSNMNTDMLEALAYMTSVNHPGVMRHWIERFLTFNDKSILKGFVNMMGRKALLELLNLQTPGQVQKIMAA